MNYYDQNRRTRRDSHDGYAPWPVRPGLRPEPKSERADFLCAGILALVGLGALLAAAAAMGLAHPFGFIIDPPWGSWPT